ncbi:MAG: hypothetical protein ACK4MD_03005 [Demequina sp.]
MTVVGVLEGAGGVARTAALLASGCSPHAIKSAVAGGLAVRGRRGVLMLPGADASLVLATDLSGELTCVTALARHGISLLRPTRTLHLGVRSGYTTAGRRARGVHLHYAKARRAPSPGTPPVASVATALDEAGRCLDERAHLVAVDAALHAGKVSMAQVAAFHSTSADRRAWLLAHADGRAESPGETLARLDIVRRGLAVHPQRFITGVGRVDLVVDDRVVVEIDGRAFHQGPESFVRDRRRGRRVVAGRLPVLRFAAAEVLGSDAIDVGAEVASFLADRPSPRMTH